jgi:hypothetical protein
MSWFSNVGKLLLIGAGLVAWLDVSGPKKVQGWAERAKRGHDETNKRWNQLNAARPDQKLVRQAARWAAFTPPDVASAWPDLRAPQADDALTAEDLQAFQRTAWTLYREDRRYTKSPLRSSPGFGFPFFEEEAYKFFIARLPEPRRDMLDHAYQELLERERRWEWVRNAFVWAILPATAVLSWWSHAGGNSWALSIIVAFTGVGMAGLSAWAALVTPR